MGLASFVLNYKKDTTYCVTQEKVAQLVMEWRNN